MSARKARAFAASVALTMLCVVPDAHAYIDPGTGSIILQGLIAAVVGGLFMLRNWWGSIKAFFRRAPASEEKGQKQP